MLKNDEIDDKNSCFNKALPNERLFVLLARDPAATVAIAAWIKTRIQMGLNKSDDPQILEAQDCITKMLSECSHIREQLHARRMK